MTDSTTVSDHRDKKSNVDIDESTVKAPNIFERAKEEFEAVIGAIHQHKSSRHDELEKVESKSEHPEDVKKKPNALRKAKEEIKSFFHHKDKPERHLLHHKETHGRSDDFDENTPIDEIKGPNVFERAKEEFEAVIDTIRSKKRETDGSDPPLQSDSQPVHSDSPAVVPDKEKVIVSADNEIASGEPEKEKAGFGCNLGKGLEKICAPWSHDKKD